MVYRGKPSAACAECRKRRSRCDYAVPECGQCHKAGRVCTGYRNTVDLMFHDESTRIVRKHKGSGSTNQSTGTAQDMQLARTASVKLTDFIFYQPIDDLGVNFFMSNYVGDDPAVSQLYYLPQFYVQKGYANSELSQAVQAAGLAGYAKTVRRKEMLDIAMKSYVKAIKGINSALSDPKSAASDATLIAIILAAMYEMLIVPRQTGMKNCSKHLAGAVTVAVMISKRKEQDEVTWKLLSTLVQSVIINSWLQQEPLPQGFEELSQRIGGIVHASSAHGQFLDLLVQLVDFRHGLQEGLYENPLAIIAKSLEIDKNLIHFMDNMPAKSRYRELRIQPEAARQLALDGYYHVYPHHFVAHLWNNCRSSRLRLHQVIIRQCHILEPTAQPGDLDSINTQRIRSQFAIEEMGRDILATVPQLGRYLEQLNMNLQKPNKQGLHVSPTSTSRIGSVTSQQRGSASVGSSVSRTPTPVTQTPTPETTPSPPSSTESEPIPNDLPGSSLTAPQFSSLYHMLFNLYVLRSITCLPMTMKTWIAGRIEWIESIADSQDVARLQQMMRMRPGDGFPVGSDEGYTKYMPDKGHGTSTGDRTVWLSVHNWFSVGWDKLGSQGFSNDWWK
ncbi:hypothetical protein ACN47E_001958 [Coniothyrium glycines]